MAKKFSDLVARMSPKSQAAAAKKADALRKEVDMAKKKPKKC